MEWKASFLPKKRYMCKFATTIFACLQSMVGFPRDHFWYLQLKKKKKLSQAIRVFVEQL